MARKGDSSLDMEAIKPAGAAIVQSVWSFRKAITATTAIRAKNGTHGKSVVWSGWLRRSSSKWVGRHRGLVPIAALQAKFYGSVSLAACFQFQPCSKRLR